MPVRGLRQTPRGLPFAPAYAYYTRRIEASVNDLRGLMTVRDLAVITGLSWDTVKHIVHLLQNGNPIENCSVPIGSCGRGLRL